MPRIVRVSETVDPRIVRVSEPADPKIVRLLVAGPPIGWPFRYVDWNAGGDLADWSPILNSELAIATANKQQLTLSAGTFRLQSVLNLLNDTYLVGQGKDRTILWTDPTILAFPLLAGGDRDSGPVKNVVVKDMTLEGNVDLCPPLTSSAPLVNSHNFENWSFIRVRLQNSRGYCMGLEGWPFAGSNKEGEQIDLYLEDVDLYRAGWARVKQTALTNSISATDTTITVDDPTQLDPLGGTMMIGTEAIRHGAFTGPTTTVIRGICGSTAAAHAAGDPLYKLQDADGIDTKSGRRHHYVRVHSKNCTDKGMNPRCDVLTMDGCHDNGSVIGIGLNSYSPSVTSTLAVAMTATDVACVLVDASQFPDSGRGTVETETISWTSKSGNTLNGLLRGLDGTIATDHLIASVSGVIEDNYEQLCSLSSCFSEDNTLSGIAVSGGGASRVMRVDLTGCHVRRSSAGFNLSGGGEARMYISVNGGSARDCSGAGLSLTSPVEGLHIGGGFLAMNNGGSGIELQDQVNGGIIDGVILLANERGILERGKTDWMQYGHIIARDSSIIDLSICNGLNSTWMNRAHPWSNNQYNAATAYQASWTPGTIPNGGYASVLVPAANATTGSAVRVLFFNISGGLPDGMFMTAKGLANQVKVFMWNFSGVSQTIGAATVRVEVAQALTQT